MSSVEQLLILDQDFDNKMTKDILPWIKSTATDAFVDTSDHIRLHYIYVPAVGAKNGTIVISHGFCEFIPKYYEVIYYFANMGYDVYMHEYRGHGFSTRQIDDKDKVYVGDFDDYVLDLETMVDKVVIPHVEDRNQLYLFAHSMGGCVGSLYLEKHPDVFAKAILSSPMMKMNVGSTPRWLVKILFAASMVLSLETCYTPGQHGFDDRYVFATSSAMSQPRYAFAFNQRKHTYEYRTYGSTYAWASAGLRATKRLLKNADKIACPVLLFQAGMDSMVLPEGHQDFLAKANGVTFVRFENTKHEIFNGPDDTRKEYYQRIFDFL